MEQEPIVLVIDDSEIARRAMVRALDGSGVATKSLSTPIGATRCILQHNIQLVVIDVNMPAMRGDRLAALFRGNPRFKRLKLVLVSGLEADALAKLASDAGADAVVGKTGDYHHLVNTVKTLLKEGA